MVLLWIGPNPLLCIFKPQFFENILRKSDFIKKPAGYRFIKQWLGNGLLTSNGKIWKTKRKLLNPSFQTKILDDYISSMNEQIEIFIELLNSSLDREFIDIRQPIINLTLDLILVTVMGIRLDAQKNENNEYINHLNNVLNISSSRIVNPIYAVDAIFSLTKVGRLYKESIKALHRFTENIIEERKKVKNGCNECNRRKDFLDLLIELQAYNSSITDEMLRQDVDTFLFAGHDTTAMCLIWTLFLL
ncbi:Cytochrome P450 4V2-like protein, partial [Dinothrombium tinctorium]